MDRVLRWLSVISLVLLVLDAAWAIGELPRFAFTLRLINSGAPAYLLGTLLLPITTAAVCEVTGITAFALSLQRKQWGWFVGILLALVIHFYAGIAIVWPGTATFLYQRVGSPFLLSVFFTLYGVLSLTPLTVLALVYTWTRRQPSNAGAAISSSPADSR